VCFPNGNHFYVKQVSGGSGVGGTNWSGAFPVFVDAMLRRYGIPWEEITRSARAGEAYPASSYTQCVFEIAIGNADLAFMNALATTSRLALTSFSGPIMHDKYYLIIKREVRSPPRARSATTTTTTTPHPSSSLHRASPPFLPPAVAK
jgi:hypothetical protein